ncbi:hypothetical protein [Streptomyces sp. NBC_01244]|uniref:hypothetical protein n=1 Tax=Streptomyces sp. NBC_01244 TaxID=2903797 RepID=UPI002E0E5BD3|nr:hypothetical protein OG247_17885 [Streptomyces sp. NBC_01244]
MNVTSDGGKVHIADPTQSDEHPRPLYRTEAMNDVTFYFTDAPVDCNTCILLSNINRNNATDGETMPPKKKTEAAPAAEPAQDTPVTSDAPADVDALISDIHATVDQLKAIDPASEGATGAATALKSEAEAKIRQLPTAKRNTLRKAVTDAFKVATTKPEPAAAPAAAAPSTEVATVSDDPKDWANLPTLIATGIEKMKEGVDAGLQLTNAGEVVAKVLLTIRQNIIDPETKLPDLVWRLKVGRNAAGQVYADALKDVAEDDIERRESHSKLMKATQNKAADVLVDWLRSYNRDDKESMELLAEMYPDAVKLLHEDDAKRAGMVADETIDSADIPEPMTAEAAIRALYAKHDIKLPLRGRTEQMRLTRRVESIQKATKELEEAKEANNTAKTAELEGRIADLKSDLPDDMLALVGAPEKEKTDAEKTNEALERAWTALETAGKRAKKVKNAAQKNKIKREMYAKIRELAETFDLDLSALVPAEESGE